MKSSSFKFIFGESYNKEVKSVLGSMGNVDIAVAFVGLGAASWFCGKNTKYRMIINLSSGATNPIEIRKIRKRKHCKIRQLDNLHAKVFISDTFTIIGSANLSANGLGLEGKETANLEEAGLVTSTSSNKRQWFEDLWNKSKTISDDDLNKAHEKWLLRCANRPIVKNKGSIDFLKNRNIKLIVSWEHIDAKVKKAADVKFKKAKVNKGLQPDKDVYSYSNFDFDNTTIYFDYWIGNKGKGKLKCNGIALPMTPKRKYKSIEYLLHDDKKVHRGIILKDYQSRITKLLKTYLKTIKLSKREGGIIIELNEMLINS